MIGFAAERPDRGPLAPISGSTPPPSRCAAPGASFRWRRIVAVAPHRGLGARCSTSRSGRPRPRPFWSTFPALPHAARAQWREAGHLGCPRWPQGRLRFGARDLRRIAASSFYLVGRASTESRNDAPQFSPGVAGISMLVIPSGDNASTIAFVTAAGDPMVADSPHPLDAEGVCGCTDLSLVYRVFQELLKNPALGIQ